MLIYDEETGTLEMVDGVNEKLYLELNDVKAPDLRKWHEKEPSHLVVDVDPRQRPDPVTQDETFYSAGRGVMPFDQYVNQQAGLYYHGR